MLVAACAAATAGCNLSEKIAELRADKDSATPAVSGSAAAPADDRVPGATTDERELAAPIPSEAPSAAASTSSEPAAETETTKPEDIIPACSKEVGVDRSRTLWRDCLKASADRSPDNLQKENCFANQSRSCSRLHQGIQNGCLTGEAPTSCTEYLNRLIDVTCNIKTVDWKNHRFPQGFFKIAGQDDDNFWEIKGGAGKSQAHRVSLGQVLHADLDGDGSTEALVAADVQPDDPRASITSSMVAVFEGDGQCNIRHRDSIAIVHGATTSVLKPPVFSVEANRLIGIWEEFDPQKSEDLLKIRTEWTLKDHKLKEARKKVERVAGGNAGATAGAKPADETTKPNEETDKNKSIRPKRKSKGKKE